MINRLLLVLMEKPSIHFEFSNWLSLVIILLIVVGSIAWVTTIYFTQRRIIRVMVTKTDLHNMLEAFKKEVTKEI